MNDRERSSLGVPNWYWLHELVEWIQDWNEMRWSKKYPNAWHEYTADKWKWVEQRFHRSRFPETDINAFIWIQEQLGILIQEYEEKKATPSGSEAFYNGLLTLKKDPFWDTAFGKVARGIHLPMYAKLTSHFIRIATHTGQVFSIFNGDRQKEGIGALILYHAKIIEKALEQQNPNTDLLLTYRTVLPTLCFNYGLACMYVEDFDNASRYTALSLKFSQQLGNQSEALRATILAGDILRSQAIAMNNERLLEEAKNIVESLKWVMSSAEMNGDILLQYNILCALLDSKSIPKQLKIYRTWGDTEDFFRAKLAQFQHSLSLSYNDGNTLDEWDKGIDSHGASDSIYIIFPWLIQYLQKRNVKSMQDWNERDKKYIAWIYRFVLKNQESLVQLNISWYRQFLELLAFWDDDGFSNAAQIAEGYKNSFDQQFSHLFPVYFIYNGELLAYNKWWILKPTSQIPTWYSPWENGIFYNESQRLPTQDSSQIASAVRWLAFRRNIEAVFRHIHTESRDLYTAIQEVASEAAIKIANILAISNEDISWKESEQLQQVIEKMRKDAQEAFSLVGAIGEGARSMLDRIANELDQLSKTL